jgi:hypothetical protein
MSINGVLKDLKEIDSAIYHGSEVSSFFNFVGEQPLW